jgi:hypothetical protein
VKLHKMGSCISFLMSFFLFIVVVVCAVIDEKFSYSLVTRNGSTFPGKGTTGAMINADVNGALWTLITCDTRLYLGIQPL